MLRSFFLGFIKIHILHHAAEEPIYGLAIIEELQHHGYDLSPGTLYPILHSMERDGYLERQNRTVEGKIRKYYAITAEGKKALLDAREKIRELVDEVMEEHGNSDLSENSSDQH